MATSRLYFVPLAITLLLPCSVMLTYSFAVGFDHVAAIFPYISDTGTFSPESCIFAQAMNIIAVLNFIFAWIRYSHVKVKCSTDVTFSFVLCLNRLSYWLAISVTIGFSMVGNFSETGLLFAHVVGALFLFIPSLAYIWIQALISIWTTNVISSRMVGIIRMVLASLGTFIMLLETISTPIAFYLFHGDNFRKWKPDDGGYEFHLVSTISEWILCIGYAGFIMTFIGEFQRIQVETPEIRLLSETQPLTHQQAQLTTSDQHNIHDDNAVQDYHYEQHDY